MARFRYFCIAGTGGRFHDWAHNPVSAFHTAMKEDGGEPIMLPGGFFYTWDGRLQGLPFMGDAEWHRQAEVVGNLLDKYPLEDRIVWCHSHGGQIAIILAAKGFKLRTLNTVATPVRPNLCPEDAVKHVGYWQHLYDPKLDWIGTAKRRLGLGGIGGGASFGDRRFIIPGASNLLNVGIPGARHSGVFASHLEVMRQAGCLVRSYQLGL